MCFMLYAGTSKPLPRRAWQQGVEALGVESLGVGEEPVRSWFSSPEVQCIGSTSCCGCDFPYISRYNGDLNDEFPIERDAEQYASDRLNLDLLINLLKGSGEIVVELYGIWYDSVSKQPVVRGDISIEAMLSPHFHFKEGGFYRLNIGRDDDNVLAL